MMRIRLKTKNRSWKTTPLQGTRVNDWFFKDYKD